MEFGVVGLGGCQHRVTAGTQEHMGIVNRLEGLPSRIAEILMRNWKADIKF